MHLFVQGFVYKLENFIFIFDCLGFPFLLVVLAVVVALFKSWIAAGHNQKALGFMKVTEKKISFEQTRMAFGMSEGIDWTGGLASQS